MAKKKLLLVDDHNVVRSGLRMLLEAEEGVEVVGEAVDGLDAIEKVEELLPDVVLMDITMPRLNGLEATRQIKRKNPDIGILFLTMHQSEEFFFHALKVGASGYVPKSAQDTEILEAVRAVGQGLTYIHPSVASSLVTEYLETAQGGEAVDPYEKLTDREKEILHSIAEGNTNREIAEALHVSVNTVHNHRTNIMDKLGLHNRMDLLKYAVRKGLISIDT